MPITPNGQDNAAARRFLDGCYDDSVRRLSQEHMERLIALGWVERVKGGYAETQALRSIDLTRATTCS